MWSPEKEPYRVVTYAQAGTSLQGWGSTTETFANLEQAMERLAQRFPAGVTKRCLDVAEIFPKKPKHGARFKWRAVASRKRKKEIIIHTAP